MADEFEFEVPEPLDAKAAFDARFDPGQVGGLPGMVERLRAQIPDLLGARVDARGLAGEDPEQAKALAADLVRQSRGFLVFAIGDIGEIGPDGDEVQTTTLRGMFNAPPDAEPSEMVAAWKAIVTSCRHQLAAAEMAAAAAEEEKAYREFLKEIMRDHGPEGVARYIETGRWEA